MKTEKEIREEIQDIKRRYKHVLRGSRATIDINAPRALMQIDAEVQLISFYWVLGESYKSKLKGVNT